MEILKKTYECVKCIVPKALATVLIAVALAVIGGLVWEAAYWGLHLRNNSTGKIMLLVALFGGFGGLINGLMSSGGILMPATYQGTVKTKDVDGTNVSRTIEIIVLGVFGNIIIGVAAAWSVFLLGGELGRTLIMIGERKALPSISGLALGVALLAGVGGAKLLETLLKAVQWAKFASLPTSVTDTGTTLGALRSVAEQNTLKVKHPGLEQKIAT